MSAPAFQFYVNKFIADTVELTDAQIGCYIRLLCKQWKDGFIPSDPEDIALTTRTPPVEFNENIWPKISRYFIPTEGGLINQKLEESRKKSEDWIKKSKKGGRASALSRQANANHPSTNNTPVVKPGRNTSSSSSTSNKKENIKEREKIFYDQVAEVGKENSRYTRDLLRRFYNYWTETTRNRQKMRFELQPTFDIELRLGTFLRNENDPEDLMKGSGKIVIPNNPTRT